MSDATGARVVDDNTTGHVPYILTEQGTEGLTLDRLEQHIDTLTEQVRLLVTAVNGKLSVGDGKQSTITGCLDGVNIQYSFTSVAAVQAIPHNLGRKPIGWLVVDVQWAAIGTNPMPDILSCGSSGDPLYGGADNKVSAVPTDWDNRVVYFRLAGANTNWLPALFRIWLF
jgi:hypothetical protein